MIVLLVNVRTTTALSYTLLTICFTFVSVDSTRARQAFTDAQSALERLKTEKTEKEGEIGEIFDVHGFGREGEWKKLDGQCVQTDSGEYVDLFISRSHLGLICISPFHVTQLHIRAVFLW